MNVLIRGVVDQGTECHGKEMSITKSLRSNHNRFPISKYSRTSLLKGYVRERDKLAMEDVQEKITLHLATKVSCSECLLKKKEDERQRGVVRL